MATKERTPAREDHRQAVLENKAKLVYGVWAHRVGWDAAWEFLEPRHRIAFKEVVEFLGDEPTCRDCGEGLLCIDCDSEEVYECPECEERKMETCVKCAEADPIVIEISGLASAEAEKLEAAIRGLLAKDEAVHVGRDPVILED